MQNVRRHKPQDHRTPPRGPNQMCQLRGPSRSRQPAVPKDSSGFPKSHQEQKDSKQMLRQPNHRHRSTSGISILQINTQRSSRVHAAALQLACADDIEIICVQEPWVNRNAEEEAETQKTQTHPRYDIFSPLGTWTTRPRTMIYIRKAIKGRRTPRHLHDHSTHEPRPSRCDQHLQRRPRIGKNQ